MIQTSKKTPTDRREQELIHAVKLEIMDYFRRSGAGLETAIPLQWLVSRPFLNLTADQESALPRALAELAKDRLVIIRRECFANRFLGLTQRGLDQIRQDGSADTAKPAG